jgi:hypothetical protein
MLNPSAALRACSVKHLIVKQRDAANTSAILAYGQNDIDFIVQRGAIIIIQWNPLFSIVGAFN